MPAGQIKEAIERGGWLPRVVVAQPKRAGAAGSQPAIELRAKRLPGQIVSQSALSQHLAILRESRLVSGRRKSQTVFYEVDHATLAEVKGRLGDIIPVEAGVQDEPNLQAHDANAALLSALS